MLLKISCCLNVVKTCFASFPPDEFSIVHYVLKSKELRVNVLNALSFS
jgi:hypothetical protein